MNAVLSSFAQEESLSTSENMKWRIRKDFQEGRFHGKPPLGYTVHDGVLVVVPEEAEIVRGIFADYFSGLGRTAIARRLRANGIILSIAGIRDILRNITYRVVDTAEAIFDGSSQQKAAKQ